MRIYYLNSEYEPGRHKILKVWREVDGAMPEDSPRTTINVPFTVIDIDEWNNRLLCCKLARNERGTPEHQLPDRYYVNNSGDVVENDTGLTVSITPNPQKESYKTSPLYGKTQAEVEAMIDSAKDLTGLKAILKKIYVPVSLIADEVKMDAAKAIAATSNNTKLDG